jgi:hypothetical protein
MEGRSGTGTSRCWVFWSPRHDCVAVFVYGDEVTHYPAEMAAGGLGDEPIVLGPDATPDPKLAAWRERYAWGGPKASLYNARLAIVSLGLKCSHDTFHNQLWIGRSDAAAPNDPKPAFLGQVTDAAIGGLRWLLSDTYGLDFTEKHVRDAVNILCGENQFNPVLDMLAEAEASWDGKPRLDRMAVDHFNCADTELNRQMVRKTMIAAVARVRTPGCKFDTILTMEAPEGLNKSSAWAALAGEGNFSDEPIIGKHGKEVMEQLADVWIHESADLAGLGKREVEAVKSFASRVRDRARPAYGHFLVDQPRHSIEVATTNNEEYLLSQTGNRRFWPIKVQRSIDIQKLKAARLQLWGEAAACQSRGESLVLDEALWSAAGVEQEARRIQHPWEALLANLDTVASGGPVAGIYIGNGIVHEAGTEQRVATSAIFEHVLRVPNGQLHNGHSKALADAMRKLGWSRCVFLLEGKTVRGYSRTVIT